MKKLLSILLTSLCLTVSAFDVGIYEYTANTGVVGINGDPSTIFIVEESDDLEHWYPMIEVFGGTEIQVDPGFYRARTCEECVP